MSDAQYPNETPHPGQHLPAYNLTPTKLLLLAFVLGALFAPLRVSAETMSNSGLQLIIPQLGSLESAEISQYYQQLLRLALSKTTPTETVEITQYPQRVRRERIKLLIEQGHIDIFWSTSNQLRESQLLPIKFNLLRGLNEYRILLIRTGEQHLFDAIHSYNDLRKFKVGSGPHWSDTYTYDYNRLPLVKTTNYSSMFRMLAAKRFDYMARGLQEIHAELSKYGHLGLVQEQNIMLHYPQPIYFYVRKDNSILAQRIQQGLKRADADGSLDTLFFSFPRFQQAWDELQHHRRNLIVLPTPPRP